MTLGADRLGPSPVSADPWEAITDVDYYVKAVEACELQMSKRIVQAAKRAVGGWEEDRPLKKGPYIFG